MSTTPFLMKEESIKHISPKLNSYHDDIKSTYETEKDGKLSFLEVLIMHKDSGIETTVYIPQKH